MKRATPLAIACFIVLLAACQPARLPTAEAPTTTPEIYIPLDKAIPDYGIILEGVHLQIAGTTLSDQFPTGCTGRAPACTQAKAGTRILSVRFAPRNLPEGNMLAYKNLPAVSVGLEGGSRVPYSLSLYNNADHNLTIGFEVPAEAQTFGLQWGDLAELPLNADGH